VADGASWNRSTELKSLKKAVLARSRHIRTLIEHWSRGKFFSEKVHCGYGF
jgi:hypothetical protein